MMFRFLLSLILVFQGTTTFGPTKTFGPTITTQGAGASAVAYDNSVSVNSSPAVASLTTGSFTVSASAKTCIVYIFIYNGGSGLITSVTCGGVTASAISGASNSGSSPGLYAYCAISPASGSQTASVNFSPNQSNVSLAAITATGGSGGCNNGNNVHGAAPQSLSITSTSGQLTTSCSGDTNQTQETSNQTRVVADWCGVDYGPGTGTTTHTWSGGTANTTTVGANFI